MKIWMEQSKGQTFPLQTNQRIVSTYLLRDSNSECPDEPAPLSSHWQFRVETEAPRRHGWQPYRVSSLKNDILIFTGVVLRFALCHSPRYQKSQLRSWMQLPAGKYLMEKILPRKGNTNRVLFHITF